MSARFAPRARISLPFPLRNHPNVQGSQGLPCPRSRTTPLLFRPSVEKTDAVSTKCRIALDVSDRSVVEQAVADNGNVVCLSDEGATAVVKGGKEFERLSMYVVGDVSLAMPAVADGQLRLHAGESLHGMVY